jgi:membrane fusion protein (multidrug efflux system)
MRVFRYHWALCAPLAAVIILTTGCADRVEEEAAAASSEQPVVPTKTAAAEERTLTRFITVTGTLTAEEEAEVAAEVAGRVVATPIERGTRVGAGGVLVRISDIEVEAQVREAEANTAQIAARLGLANGGRFEIDTVPEVANAKAAQAQALADLSRAEMLFERKLLPQADLDQRRTQAEAAKRQHETARNTAEQQYQSLMAAQARLALARKALADTVVRSPFDGLVGERLVSVGDYVTRGMKVASVMRTGPLRVELTVPEQAISSIGVGREVSLEVDAYPGKHFMGRVRYISPAVTASSRSLVVEAVVNNPDGVLKPGFFASARIETAQPTPALMVPKTAVRNVAGTDRVFIATADRVEERIVTLGQQLGEEIEITSGLQKGDIVATSNVERLEDGVRIAAGQ